MPEGTVLTKSSTLRSIKVGVFECESSGGVEWLREDTLVIDKKPLYLKRFYFDSVYLNEFKTLSFSRRRKENSAETNSVLSSIRLLA